MSIAVFLILFVAFYYWANQSRHPFIRSLVDPEACMGEGPQQAEIKRLRQRVATLEAIVTDKAWQIDEKLRRG